jgi:hypothetical protein
MLTEVLSCPDACWLHPAAVSAASASPIASLSAGLATDAS